MDRKKVLIVEDEIDLLDLVDFNLTRKGFITDFSMDGNDAVEKVHSFDPGVVILDLMLPKLDGLEVCRQIRREKPDVKLIMLTAKSLPEDRERGFEAGADDYMTKPFSVKELVSRVEGLVNERPQGSPELNNPVIIL